jgi:hypothetical protein
MLIVANQQGNVSGSSEAASRISVHLSLWTPALKHQLSQSIDGHGSNQPYGVLGGRGSAANHEHE